MFFRSRELNYLFFICNATLTVTRDQQTVYNISQAYLDMHHTVLNTWLALHKDTSNIEGQLTSLTWNMGRWDVQLGLGAIKLALVRAVQPVVALHSLNAEALNSGSLRVKWFSLGHLVKGAGLGMKRILVSHDACVLQDREKVTIFRLGVDRLL